MKSTKTGEKSKNEIRSCYKRLRNEMTEKEVAECSQKICAHILSSEIFKNAKYIFAYYPLGNEADIRPVVKEAWKQGKHVAFPKVFGEKMVCFEVSGFEQLHTGTFDVMEPEETYPVFWEHALVLVPGVVFDRKKNRMGFGKGYYDRYLTGCPECITMGISYEWQVTEKIPVEETDVPLQFLVTERGIL